MGKIMEAVFCILYLAFTTILGTLIMVKARKCSSREFCLYGIMALVLVFGDSFHLVPRILTAFDPQGNYGFALGFGKMITSITMTLFYLMMFFIYRMRYQKKMTVLTVVMIVLAALRIALCLSPQNDWTGAAPVIWGIYRNIPFAMMGIVMIVLYFVQKKDRPFKWMWLAIALSFAFYIPVVLWAEVHPMIGMLMLPKTCMYIWIVAMGKKAVSSKK